jgi:hypothetical protein
MRAGHCAITGKCGLRNLDFRPPPREASSPKLHLNRASSAGRLEDGCFAFTQRCRSTPFDQSLIGGQWFVPVRRSASRSGGSGSGV